ncbi:hypothetical protein K1719_005891 [Acacia pycnantha]|nr:hypothetical protein K1719_026140 [Acacia pycnantha]KAI9123002.1 hypothetical protein K1719_005891 [Acacia pycnantha]
MDPYKSEIVLMVFHRPSSTGLLFIVSLADCCGVHIGVVLAVCLADLCMQGSSFLVGLECRSALLIGSLSCRWLLFAWGNSTWLTLFKCFSKQYIQAVAFDSVNSTT